MNATFAAATLLIAISTTLSGCGAEPASSSAASNSSQIGSKNEDRVVDPGDGRTITLPNYGPMTGTLEFIEPAPNTRVTAGSKLKVTVKPSKGFKPQGIMIFCQFDTQVAESSPYTVELNIPKDAIGELRLGAMSFDEKWNSAFSPRLLIPIDVHAKRIKLMARNTFESPSGEVIMAMFGFHPTQQVILDAKYDDGVTRSLWKSGIKLTYRTEDPKIASVDEAGMLTIHMVGSTKLFVSDGALTLPITVVVSDEEGELSTPSMPSPNDS